MVKAAWTKFKEQRRLYKIYLTGKYLAVFCALRWKRSRKLFASKLDHRVRKKVCQHFTFVVQTSRDYVYHQSALIVKEFLRDKEQRLKML